MLLMYSLRECCACARSYDSKNRHEGEVVFIGSSIFHFWRTLARDMRPLPVINNAAGGYRSGQLVRHAVGLTGASPLVVIYVGSNDIRFGVPATDAAANVAAIIDLLLQHVPARRIILVGAIASPDQNAAIVNHLNRLYYDLCAEKNAALSTGVKDDRVFFVNPNSVMEAHPDYYRWDNIHLTEAGYAALTQVVRPAVERMWSLIGSTADAGHSNQVIPLATALE